MKAGAMDALTRAAYVAVAEGVVTEVTFPDILDALNEKGLLFDHLVKAELAARKWPADADAGEDAVSLEELTVAQDLAFQIGVAVGRRLR
jgi:hypothetical protein